MILQKEQVGKASERIPEQTNNLVVAEFQEYITPFLCLEKLQLVVGTSPRKHL